MGVTLSHSFSVKIGLNLYHLSVFNTTKLKLELSVEMVHLLQVLQPKVYGSYVFLDTDEREFFANGEHELLITQTQHQPMSASDTSIDLDLL